MALLLKQTNTQQAEAEIHVLKKIARLEKVKS
jgi:hypothetical protein